MLKNIDIRSLAGERAYEKGRRYFERDAVGRIHETPLGEYTEYRAWVSGSARYDVSVELGQNDRIWRYSCTCPAAQVNTRACKHVVALLKAVQALENQRASRSTGKIGTTKAGEAFLKLFAPRKKEAGKENETPLQLDPVLWLADDYGQRRAWLEFRIGRERPYIVRNIAEFLQDIAGGVAVSFGKQLTLTPEEMDFAPGASAKLWAFLTSVWRDERSLRSYASYRWDAGAGRPFDKKRLYLTPSLLEQFFAIMEGKPFLVIMEGEGIDAQVKTGLPSLHLRLEKAGEGGAVTFEEADQLTLLDSKGRIALLGSVIYRVPKEKAADLARLAEGFAGAATLSLGEGQVGEFFTRALSAVKNVPEVTIAPSFSEQYELFPLAAEAYFDYQGDGIAARLLFRYGEAQYNPLTEKAPPRSGKKYILRDTESEERIMELFAAYDFTPENGRLVQAEEERSYEFLREGLPKLDALAAVFFADSFRRRPVQDMPPIKLGVSVSADNLLEVKFKAQDLDFEEVAAILSAYRLKRRYHRLKDGSFVTLEGQRLDALADFFGAARLEKQAEGAVAPLSQALYLDAAAREETGLQLDRSQNFCQLVREITAPERDTWPVPEAVAGILRDYQAQGFNWLMTLATHGLGGILADDMGLGKTLEVIAFLLARRQEGASPTLVVTPTSLMYNWLEEIERFAPELRALTIAGSKKERRARLAAAMEQDVVVTTYNLLKRDIADYETRSFRYCFLDEAQHIKNPTTQNAKAVKRLHTGGYFALTGTPIENTLTELWSIFDFLMPGYLSSYAQFRARYEVPIVRDENDRAAADLRRHIAPFVLRRLKKDVLTELPDKVESKLVNEMTPAQEKVYKAWFVRGQKEFAAILAAHGVETGRIKILAILTRLRQIACDPALFLEDYDGGSGKLELLSEVVTDAVASGHRLLIFSQFTTMLKRIAARLEELRLGYLYLDGQTPAMERLRLVNDFNAGDTPLFLISLKAGGTGLNLTGADMVIHYDPWWNPAVEEQATDRAYRIGQENKVQVLKLVTKDTIEEKIFALQERKKALIDQMIQPGENFLAKLSEDELKSLFR